MTVLRHLVKPRRLLALAGVILFLFWLYWNVQLHPAMVPTPVRRPDPFQPPPQYRPIVPTARHLSASNRRNHDRQAHRDPEAAPDRAYCLNTKQGPLWLTDDTGASCPLQAVADNGCCMHQDTTEMLSCGSCRQDLQCCQLFERCVSCCLAQQPPELARFNANLWSKGGGGISLGRSRRQYPAGVFEQCLYSCRTSSHSLKHGNKYNSDLRHCYGPQGSLTQQLQLAGPAGGGATAQPLNPGASRVIKSSPGGSCRDACLDGGMVCQEAFLERGNACAALAELFPEPCSRGCASGLDLPFLPAVMLDPASGLAQLHQDSRCVLNGGVSQV